MSAFWDHAHSTRISLRSKADIESKVPYRIGRGLQLHSCGHSARFSSLSHYRDRRAVSYRELRTLPRRWYRNREPHLLLRFMVGATCSMRTEQMGTVASLFIVDARSYRKTVERTLATERDGMASSSRPTRTSSGHQPAEARTGIIRVVTSPLGFFVLVVLVVEAILGVLAGLSASADRTELVRTMATIVVILIATVAGLAWFRPEALMGTKSPVIDDAAISTIAAAIKVFTQSNDFLSSGGKSQFPSNSCADETRGMVYWNHFLYIP